MLYDRAIRGFEGPIAPEWCLSGPDSLESFFRFSAATRYKTHMPRISDKLLDGIAFQYRTRQEAAARLRLGGSSFLVGRPIKGSIELFGHPKNVPYLVSNKHVVLDSSACVASVNRKDGSEPDIWEIDQNDWFPHPGGDDLAATCVAPFLNMNVHKISFVKEENFLTPAFMKDSDLGVGDEVFMLGRFLNHQGKKKNHPAARFGNISMMLDKLRGENTTRDQVSFAVEMRSRTGFSGSPVVAYRTPATVLMDVPKGYENFWCVLGVNWGYVFDETKENTWLNGVVPAWKITELLNIPELLAIQEEHELVIKKMANEAGGVKLSVGGDVLASNKNPTHREDFTVLLTKAAKTQPQDD